MFEHFVGCFFCAGVYCWMNKRYLILNQKIHSTIYTNLCRIHSLSYAFINMWPSCTRKMYVRAMWTSTFDPEHEPLVFICLWRSFYDTKRLYCVCFLLNFNRHQAQLIELTAQFCIKCKLRIVFMGSFIDRRRAHHWWVFSTVDEQFVFKFDWIFIGFLSVSDICFSRRSSYMILYYITRGHNFFSCGCCDF